MAGPCSGPLPGTISDALGAAAVHFGPRLLGLAGGLVAGGSFVERRRFYRH